MKLAQIPFLAALTLSLSVAHASQTQSVSSPLPDYSRDDLGGCAEAVPFSPETASTLLYCPGVGGVEVTLEVAGNRETLGFRQAGKRLGLKALPAPTGESGAVLSTNAGFSGSQGIQQLALEWRVRFDGATALDDAQVLGVIYPVSYNFDAGHGATNVRNYWAVVNLKSACVTDYVLADGTPQSIARARQLADGAANRACL